MDYIDKYKKAARSNFCTPEMKKDKFRFYIKARLDVARGILSGLIIDPRNPK
jgi:hypothetical protein